MSPFRLFTAIALTGAILTSARAADVGDRAQKTSAVTTVGTIDLPFSPFNLGIVVVSPPPGNSSGLAAALAGATYAYLADYWPFAFLDDCPPSASIPLASADARQELRECIARSLVSRPWWWW